jgi:hypothetical protein
MAIELRNGPEPSLTSLVNGIIHDVQELMHQQLHLFKEEITSDFEKAKEVTISVALAWALGLAGVVVGAGMLLVMLVHLLNWATQMPMWGCYGLVGAAALALGAGLLVAGKKKLETFHPLPEQSVQALKENVQCLTNPSECASPK